jgi:hypothetical protein
MRAAALVASLALASCSGSSSSSAASAPKPPVIDTAEPSQATITLAPPKIVTFTVDVTGHDDDDNVVTLKTHFPIQPSADQTEAIPNPSGKIAVRLLLGFATAPKGPLEYELTLVDASGLSSDPVKKTITVE